MPTSPRPAKPLKQLTQFERRATAAILQKIGITRYRSRSTFHPSGGKAADYRAWRISKHIGTVKIPWVEFEAEWSAEERKKRNAKNGAKREESFAKALAIAQRDYDRSS